MANLKSSSTDSMLEKFGLSVLSLAGNFSSGIGSNKKLMILIFHRVLSELDEMRPGEITKKEFSWQMSLLSQYFNVIPLIDGIEKMKLGRLPSRAVAITFDDGYRDNLTNAFPVLKKHKLPATIFVAAGYMNGGRMWNDSVVEAIRKFEGEKIDLSRIGIGECSVKNISDRLSIANQVIREIKHLPFEEREEKAEFIANQVENLPEDLMLSDDEIRNFHDNGIDIGGHTMSHPILTKITDEQAENEIVGGKEALEKITGKNVPLFAYPNGKPGTDYLHTHVRMVEAAGFKAAVSTNWGVGHVNSDMYQLPRFTPWDRSKLKFMARMIYMYGTSES